MADRADITPEMCRQLLRYNPETGNFTYLIRRGSRQPGDRAGSLNNGYVIIDVGRRHFKAHRLAWFFVYGKMPERHIDHINGNPSDNRICNLREVSNSENLQNTKQVNKDTKTGLAGVYLCRTGKYYSGVWLAGKYHYAGRFVSAEEAYEARKSLKAKLHPFATS